MELMLRRLSSPRERVLALGLLLNTIAPGAGLSWMGQPRWHAVYVVMLLSGAVLVFRLAPPHLAFELGLLWLGGVVALSGVHTVGAGRPSTPRASGVRRWAPIVTHLVLGLGGTLGALSVLTAQHVRAERDLTRQQQRLDYTHEVYAAVLAAHALGSARGGDCAGGPPGFPVPRRADVATCTSEGTAEPQVDVVFSDGTVYSLP